MTASIERLSAPTPPDDLIMSDVTVVPQRASMLPAVIEAARGSFVGLPEFATAEQIIKEFATTAVADACDCCPPGDINTKISRYRERIRLEMEYETAPGHGAHWSDVAIEV